MTPRINRVQAYSSGLHPTQSTPLLCVTPNDGLSAPDPLPLSRLQSLNSLKSPRTESTQASPRASLVCMILLFH